MMKQVLNILAIALLTIFSFYYTNKMVDLAKSKDPIMLEILENKNNYVEEPVNATINNNYLIPGLIGTTIDIDKSYYKMKKLGEYNENLYIFISDYPKISVQHQFNKFIISGNKKKKQIALVFKITKLDNLTEVVSCLKNNSVVGNFFIDGKVFEENIASLKQIYENNNFLGNLGYNNNYNKLTIKYTNALIEKFINYEHHYCYVEEDNYRALDICSKVNMYTIKGIPISNTNSYSDVKSKLTNGGIYSLDMNDYTIKNLNTILQYIKYKGYKIVTINELISEDKV